ncbi:hypothetical protein HNQ80_004728 [Anaerosolibacter carboniphilus]|uniref:Permease n=1 Tax=Anaerosolibacter carboniphilus TaxID=1417629 RepID=A0A841KY40_9FIRM|nr:putative manganese transporter [Anaerosolibacter carboniphilus]MBB6218554.1 hypothetical protein [Anaerosolibacter carboniphilus]
MVDILVDSMKDTIRVVPVIFLLFLFVDFFMLKVNKENRLVDKLSKYDIVGGGLLGIIPQCGIPVGFAKLYANGYITLGMLFAIFFSSSDEAFIIIGAHPDQIGFVVKLIAVKVLIGIAVGYIISAVIKEKRNRIKGCGVDCTCPKCAKDRNIFINSVIHTLKISLFLLLTVFLLSLGLERIGEEGLGTLLGKNTFMQPIYAALIGAIPSCMSSVVLAEGYLQGAVGLGALISGLCANTGYGILVVLKELPFKKALKIILILLTISIAIGEIIFVVGG